MRSRPLALVAVAAIGLLAATAGAAPPDAGKPASPEPTVGAPVDGNLLRNVTGSRTGVSSMPQSSPPLDPRYPRGHVTMTEPRVDAGLDASQVALLLKRRKVALKACYERVLRRD